MDDTRANDGGRVGRERRSVSSLWRAKPGDLPPDDVLIAQPAMRGIIDNPVYRAIALRRRGERASGRFLRFVSESFEEFSAALGGAAVFIALWFIIIFTAAFFCFALCLLVLAAILRAAISAASIGPDASGRVRRFWRGVFGSRPPPPPRRGLPCVMDEPWLTDLIQAGVDPSTFAVGMWAGAIPRRSLARRRRIIAGAFILFWIGLIGLDPAALALGGVPFHLALVVGLLGLGYNLGKSRFEAYRELTRLTERVGEVRGGVRDSATGVGLIARRVIGRTRDSAELLAMLTLLSVLGFFLVGNIGARFVAGAWADPAMWALAGGIVSSVGLGWGWWQGIDDRDRVGERLAQLTVDVGFLLRFYNNAPDRAADWDAPKERATGEALIQPRIEL
jgi:hypothetical protein